MCLFVQFNLIFVACVVKLKQSLHGTFHFAVNQASFYLEEIIDKENRKSAIKIKKNKRCFVVNVG